VVVLRAEVEKNQLLLLHDNLAALYGEAPQ
jgi:hypothetical protein